MAAITKAGLGKPAKPKIEKVPLVEAQSNGEEAYVCVRALGARDLIELRKRQGEAGDTDNMGFVHDLLARTLCDDGGALIFEGADDVAQNFNLSVGAMTTLADEACRVSGLRTQEKNSPPQSATSSPSASS